MFNYNTALRFCSSDFLAFTPSFTADSSTFAIEKQPGLKPHGAVNLISHRQLYRNCLYSSTRVVFKVVWLLQGYSNLLYLSQWCQKLRSFFIHLTQLQADLINGGLSKHPRRLAFVSISDWLNQLSAGTTNKFIHEKNVTIQSAVLTLHYSRKLTSISSSIPLCLTYKLCMLRCKQGFIPASTTVDVQSRSCTAVFIVLCLWLKFIACTLKR